MWATSTGTSSALKKKSGKESQYIVSHSELGLDPPFGSDRESGRDSLCVDYLKLKFYNVVVTINSNFVSLDSL